MLKMQNIKKEMRGRIIYGAIIMAGLIWMAWLYDTFALPYTLHLRYFEPSRTAFMDYYKGEKDLDYRWVDMKHISPYLRKAVVLAEDDSFYNHGGYDLEAIEKAAKINWRKKRLVRGASTITQQLSRNLFLSSSKNPIRKIKEFLIALKLERELSKERILEIYLNVVEWGNGIYGAEAAARHYFNHSAAALSKREAAFLASILPRPRFYDKHRTSPYLSRRVASLESRL
jgi:monofunctional biosynthetic peptidoglycan transglycosylase